MTKRIVSIRVPESVIAVVFFSLLIPFATASAQTPTLSANKDAPTRFTIAGTVVNAMTGAPLAQARVAIAETKNRGAVIQIVTSENGHFEFPNLPAGKFSLQGAKRGYLT